MFAAQLLSRTCRAVSSPRGRVVLGLGLAAWVVVGAGLTFAGRGGPVLPANRPLETPLAGYVSSDTCRSCHPDNHASWHASFHRTMTQVASPETVIPALDGLQLELGDTSFSVVQADAKFLVYRYPRGTSVTVAGPPQEIVLLTGSHNQQNFWLSTRDGRTLEPFPFGWLIEAGRWAPVTDTFMCPPDVQAGRAPASWNTACLNCHTTQGRMGYEAGMVFNSAAVEFGISCEACHGEAATHIAKHRNPVERYLARWDGQPDPSIRNPGNMPGPESALACGQCHSVWAFASQESVAKINTTGWPFRPGDAALGERYVVQPTLDRNRAQIAALHAANPDFLGDTFWGDGQVRVTGREFNGVETSPCFAGGEFSCLSCHEMHPESTNRNVLQAWAVDQLRPDGASDQTCLQCHAELASSSRLSAHTRHAPESVGSRCYECHMPHSTYGLMRAVRSHRVTSPTVAETQEFGRPNACNLCHLDQSLGWTADKLTAWYDQPTPAALSADERRIASGAYWLLKGDAAQRALVAYAMGRPEAQAASSNPGWFAPYLAISLNDPYSAVRYIAAEALRQQEGFAGFEFDYIADDETTYRAAVEAFRTAQLHLQSNSQTQPLPPGVLLDGRGNFQSPTYDRLLDTRDQRRVILVE